MMPSNKSTSSGKFVRVVLAAGNTFASNGSTTTTECDLGDAAGAFADASAVRVYVQGENFTTNFKFRVTTNFSVTGIIYSTAVDILAWRSSAAPFTSDPLKDSDRNKFGLRQKVFIEASNVTGSDNETGRLYIVLEIVRDT